MRLLGLEITRARAPAPTAPEQRVVQGNGTSWLPNLLRWFSSEARGAEEVVSEDRALTIAAVFTAVRIIAGTMASLPLHVLRRTERGREFALKHWAYGLLHDSPNEYHTTATWLTTYVAHRLLWGDWYNRIEWLRNGTAGALLPLMPWEVTPFRVADGKRIDVGTRFAMPGEQVYMLETAKGREYWASEDILHVPGLGYDGVKGLSVVRYNCHTLGTAKSMERFTGAFFRNSAKIGGILQVPARMSETAQKNLRDSLSEEMAKEENAFKTIVLEDGAKFIPYTMPLEDAQLLDARKFSRSEIITGLFGVPPHLSGDTERQTSWGTGIEQMDIGYAKHTISPLAVGLEQELKRKLFGRGAPEYAKFNLDALMRGDFKSRIEALVAAAGGPFITREEARDIEDWNMTGEPGANKLLTPLNMGVGATPPAAEPAPTSDPATPAAPDTEA